MKERFGTRMHISKSLPQFLEFAAAGVTKGSGLEFLSERLGPHFYNQALHDARALLHARVEALGEAFYELEKPAKL